MDYDPAEYRRVLWAVGTYGTLESRPGAPGVRALLEVGHLVVPLRARGDGINEWTIGNEEGDSGVSFTALKRHERQVARQLRWGRLAARR